MRSEELPSEEPIGLLEPVAYFNEAMPTGVTVSQQGRIFINIPKWGDDVSFTVTEIREGSTVPYPNEALNQTDENDLAAALISVQSVVVDPADRLWILDTGSPPIQTHSVWWPKVGLRRSEYGGSCQEDLVSSKCGTPNYLS
jgi:hypothetical protein